MVAENGGVDSGNEENVEENLPAHATEIQPPEMLGSGAA